MSLTRKGTNQSNQSPGQLLYLHLKTRYKTTEEIGKKIEQIRLTPNGIETIKEAMKIDQDIYDAYQTELKPLKDARKYAAYDHTESCELEAGYGSIKIGVGGEAAKLDDLIKKVESKYQPSLAIYRELKYATLTDELEREEAIEAEKRAIEAQKIAAEKEEADQEFNNIVELTRARGPGH